MKQDPIETMNVAISTYLGWEPRYMVEGKPKGEILWIPPAGSDELSPPLWSEDEAAATRLVEEMGKRGWTYREKAGKQTHASFDRTGDERGFSGRAFGFTRARAVAKAALGAIIDAAVR